MCSIAVSCSVLKLHKTCYRCLADKFYGEKRQTVKSENNFCAFYSDRGAFVNACVLSLKLGRHVNGRKKVNWCGKERAAESGERRTATMTVRHTSLRSQFKNRTRTLPPGELFKKEHVDDEKIELLHSAHMRTNCIRPRRSASAVSLAPPYIACTFFLKPSHYVRNIQHPTTTSSVE